MIDEKLKSLIGQYCQYPCDSVWADIFKCLDEFPCPRKDMRGYAKAYKQTIEYISKFDCAWQMSGHDFEGEKTDLLLDTVEECYFSYWEALRC